MDEVTELTYRELIDLVENEIKNRPELANEKAIIYIGDSSGRSSYVKGLSVVNGDTIICSSWYDHKPVKN